MATSSQRLVTHKIDDNYPSIVCSLSGWQSLQNAKGLGAKFNGGAFLSGTPSTNVCSGYSPGWWGQYSRWTGGLLGIRDTDYSTLLPHSPVIQTITYTYNSSTKSWSSTRKNATAYELMTKLKEPRPSGSNLVNGSQYKTLSVENNSIGDIWHWLGAWLNAKSNEVGYAGSANDNYPFSSQQVLSLYLEGNSDALNFIKVYMETHKPT